MTHMRQSSSLAQNLPLFFIFCLIQSFTNNNKIHSCKSQKTKKSLEIPKICLQNYFPQRLDLFLYLTSMFTISINQHHASCQHQLHYQAMVGLLSLYFIVFFLLAAQHVGSQFPNLGLNPRPMQWKHGVLTTGPPGKSQIVNAISRLDKKFNYYSR